MPGEGNLAHLFFKQSDSPEQLVDYLGVMLCYGMRIGYPLALLFIKGEGFNLIGFILILTTILFFMIHMKVIGCPHCKKTTCPGNPHRGR